MFLEYGVNDHGELVRIDETGRGRLDGVYCPYCRRPLLARKGKVLAPHFAHDGETCRAADRDADVINLPVYDRFLLHLSPAELKALRVAAGDRSVSPSETTLSLRQRLYDKGMIADNTYTRSTEVTKLGNIPLGKLSLMLFCDVQEPLIRQRHEELEDAAYRAIGTVDYSTAITDLQLYRAQWQRVLSLTLYFLEIAHAGGILHKIGVTNRTVEARAAEVAADLRVAGLEGVSVKVIDTWDRRGNVELYFKYRYAGQQWRINTLTEYFQFTDVKSVLRDLRRMKPKTLDALEMEVASGGPSRIERGEPREVLAFEDYLFIERCAREVSDPREAQNMAATIWRRNWSYDPYPVAVYADHFGAWYHRHYAAEFAEREARRAADQAAKEAADRAAARRNAIRLGMQAAAERGQHVGRPADDPAQIVASYHAVVAAIRGGLSLRAAAAATGVAVNTVRKVKAALDTLDTPPT